MRLLWGLSAVLAVCLLAGSAAPAGEMDPRTRDQLRVLEGAIDELNRNVVDHTPEQRAGRAENLNQAFVILTGEAVNPLFGVAALGMYNYFRTDEAYREYLPLYDRPEVWLPLLAIILLMLFNSTICEAMPFLKVPLNALGDMVNKAGAVAVLPLVVKMFADAVAQPAASVFAWAAGGVFPVAQAAESAASSGLWHSLGWLAGAVVGVLVYGAVWLTFNVVDVLILICPFPGIDAMLKSFRLGVVGVLAGTYHVAPTLSLILALAVVIISFFVAGWSFRLSVFGFVFSTDLLFFRRQAIGESVSAFSSGCLCAQGVPMRTLGRLEKNAEDELVFSYRPWLIRGRRSRIMGKNTDFAAGHGLLNPFVVGKTPNDVWLRLPPRHRGREAELAQAFGLSGVMDCGVAMSLRRWLAAQFGGAETTC